jgi:predicted RNA-binding Zn-ribbon protein involved in translation (DUF1610 family)
MGILTGKTNVVGWNAGCTETCLSGVGSAGRKPTAEKQQGAVLRLHAVQCPHCHSEQIVKRGKTRRGTQRYLCQNMACAKGSFLLDYRNRGCLPAVKHTVIDMSLNAGCVPPFTHLVTQPVAGLSLENLQRPRRGT